MVLEPQENPGEIKRRDTVLEPQENPGEIKRRDMVLEPQENPGEIKSWEVELGLRKLDLLQLFLNSRATEVVLVTLLHTAVETATA